MKHTMPRAPLEKMRATALEAAQDAGAVLLRHFGRKLKVREKPGAGLVTNADLEAERVALKVLKRDFGHFKFLTEESSPTPKPRKVPRAGSWIRSTAPPTSFMAFRCSVFRSPQNCTDRWSSA